MMSAGQGSLPSPGPQWIPFSLLGLQLCRKLLGRSRGDAITLAKNYTSVDEAAANGVFVLIEQSIDPELRSSIMGMTAFEAYHTLVLRFGSPSWSVMVSRWNLVANPPDGSDSVAVSHEAARRNWTNLDKRLNGITVDKLAALTFYSSVPWYQNQISDSMDARLSVIPNLPIPSVNS